MTVFRRFLIAGVVLAALGGSPAMAQKMSPYESQLKGVANGMNPSSPASVKQAQDRAAKIRKSISADLEKTKDPQKKAALENALKMADDILQTKVEAGGNKGIAVGIQKYLNDDQQNANNGDVPDYEKQVYAVYRDITWNDPDSLDEARSKLDKMKAEMDYHMANPDQLSTLQKSKMQRAMLQVNRLIPELDRRIAYFDALPEQPNQPQVQTASATPDNNTGGSIFDKAASGGGASFGDVDNAVLLGDERTLMLLKSKVGLKNWQNAAYVMVLDDLLQESVNAIRQELQKPDVPVERMTDLAKALEAVQRLQVPLQAAMDDLAKHGAKTTDDMKDEARAHIEKVLDEIRKQYKREQQYASADPTVATDGTDGGTFPITKETQPPQPGEPGYYMFIVEHYRHLYGLDGNSSMNGLNPDTQMRYLEKFSKNIPQMIERFQQKLAEAEANHDRKLADELKAALQLLKQTQTEVNQKLAMK